MDFQEIMNLVDGGEYATLLDAVLDLGLTDMGVEIPLGYGFTINVYITKDAVMELAETEVQKYILGKMYEHGGAIRVDLRWAEIPGVLSGIFYFNVRIGLILVLAGLITEIPDQMLQPMLNAIRMVCNTNRNNHFDITEIDVGLEEWFNDTYYTGLMESGKYPSAIGKVVRQIFPKSYDAVLQ